MKKTGQTLVESHNKHEIMNLENCFPAIKSWKFTKAAKDINNNLSQNANQTYAYLKQKTPAPTF